MISKDGDVQISPRGSFSFPYGAAALVRTLDGLEATGNPEAKARLAAEMQSDFETAFRDLNVPAGLHARAERERGFTLYLSGGGFRGWGYLLMSQSRIHPYPIPIINGFQVSKHDFQSINRVQEIAASQANVFRVSKRRAAQVPAVAFLINSLCLAIPNIQAIRFCQGGVREGILFDALDKETRATDPLTAATSRYALPGAAAIAALLRTAVPPETRPGLGPGQILASFSRVGIVRALADMLYEHASCPKESASLAALYCPITGVLASAHGISHGDRALLALMLCQRWAGELAPPHESLQERLRQLLSRQEVWWCNYLGRVAGLVGHVYPAGRMNDGRRLQFRAEWATGLGKKGLDEGIRLIIFTAAADPMTSIAALRDPVDGIEAVGKKKRWVGGRDGFGIRVQVRVEASVPLI